MEDIIMVWIPFICIAIGILIGLRNLSTQMLKVVDTLLNIALILLMLTIGLNIGVNDSVMQNLGAIGVNCVIIAIFAIGFSVLLIFVLEKTLVPLDTLREKINQKNLEVAQPDEDEKEKNTSALIWLMPTSIIIGVIIGYFVWPDNLKDTLGLMLTISLILLYTGVGVSLGSNRSVFQYIKVLGFKILLIPIAILVGSLLGGFLAGILLSVPISTALLSAGGMSYYSITGAFMTQMYGIEAGTYGFLVNVMREFFTVLLLPLLVKISKGSPIAAGAAGNMDTMLVPVTKFVGAELGLVALITGCILTFSVPFLFPILYGLL